ncbi:MAG: PIN domain-containing protein [Elusimicrobia bacterium]|nr:PIN domain-containing protein [Elusimicrobiota bacterium]
MPAILVDAGVLVGYLDPRDPAHAAAVAALKAAPGKPWTTWPAATEAAHLLGREHPEGRDALLAMIAEGALGLARLDAEDAPRLRQLMAKYHDLPMDLADATLVRVAEREGIDTVLTFDRRDFKVYRAAGIGALKILPKP